MDKIEAATQLFDALAELGRHRSDDAAARVAEAVRALAAPDPAPAPAEPAP